MKMYFGLLLSLCTISLVHAMDNNNNNNKSMSQEEQDLESEQKTKDLLVQMFALGVATGKYTPSNSPKSSPLPMAKRQIPPQNPNQFPFTVIISSAPNIPTLSSSPEMSRLSEGLKKTTVSSPATDRKPQNLPTSQSNNNNPFPVIMLPPLLPTHVTDGCYDLDDVNEYPIQQIGSEQKITEDSSSDDDYSDKDYVSDKDYASDEENSPFTQTIRAKNWKNADKLRKTARLLPDKDYKAAVDEYLTGLKVLHDQHQMNSEKTEQDAINKLNAIKKAPPKSNNNNDQKDNDNNKKS